MAAETPSNPTPLKRDDIALDGADIANVDLKSVEPDLPRWPFVPTPFDFTVTGAAGSYLLTETGGRILDAAGGAIVANVGHGRREVAETAADAMTSATYIVPPFSTPERERLTERLQRTWLPEGLSRVHLSSGGSEAVDTALRLARQYWLAKDEPSRTRIIARDISYHGATLATMGISGHPERKRGLEPFFVEPLWTRTPYPLRQNDPQADKETGLDLGERLAAELDALITEQGAETIAAFIAEPISGSSGGALVPPGSYWPAVRKVCDKHGVLLIADEVMTGFGRTGTAFAVEHWGVCPDILVSGKGLGGGYTPICGVYATPAIARTLKAKGMGLFFFTFGASSGACAAADKVLDILEREDLLARVREMEGVVRRYFAPLAEHPHIAEVRGKGLLWGLEIVRDKATLEPFPMRAGIGFRTVMEALKRGVYFYPGGTGEVRDIVLIGPPFIVEEAEIAQMAEVFYDSLNAVLEGVAADALESAR